MDFCCNTYSELLIGAHNMEDGDIVYCYENGRIYRVSRNGFNIEYVLTGTTNFPAYRNIYGHYESEYKSKIDNLEIKPDKEIKHRGNNYKTCFVCGQSIKNPKIGKYRDKYCEKCGVYLPEIIYKGV